MSAQPTRRPLNRALSTLAAAVLAMCAVAASAQPGLDDPLMNEPRLDLEPQIEFAIRCLTDTRVERFVATPAEVQPFEQTTLSWRVSIPPGCPVSLSVAGGRVAAAGTLEVTPVHLDSRFAITGAAVGGRTTLRSVSVGVDPATCRVEPFATPLILPTATITPPLEAAIVDFVADDDDLELSNPDDIDIQIRPNLLAITVPLKASVVPLVKAEVELEIGLRFTVREGRIYVRYVLFRPQADTALPDDVVEGRFFDRAESVRLAFERGFNQEIGALLGADEQLFDLVAVQDELHVIPCDDPGRCERLCRTQLEQCNEVPGIPRPLCVRLFRQCQAGCG